MECRTIPAAAPTTRHRAVSSDSDLAFLGLLLVCCAASLLVFFRRFVFSGFDLINGGPRDTRLLIAILEHWLTVFRGGADFASPPFFAPEAGALGYSEAMFLVSLPYAAARLVGFDRYLAFVSALIFIKALGFIALYALLRASMRVDRGIALLGAILFTVSNSYYLAAGHAQFFAVAFVPVLALLAWGYWRDRVRRRSRAILYLAAAGVLLATLLFTGFYIGWFTIVLGGVCCTAWALAGPIRRSSSAIDLTASQVVRDACFAACVFTVALLPFLLTYLPILARGGGRPFDEILLYTPHLSDALAVGDENLVWGSLLSGLTGNQADRSVFARYELQRGWPPVLLAIFVVTTILSLARTIPLRHGARRIDRVPALVPVVLGATALLGWSMSIRVGDLTAWWLVYALVPGASAIRVPVRINFVLNILVIVVAMLGVGHLKRALAARFPSARTLVKAGLSVLSVMLIAEQLNGAETFRLSRAAEVAIFDRIDPTPSECRYFYAVKPGTAHDAMDAIAIQTEAMLVAQERGVPTLNGYSGGVPPGWNLLFLDGDYVDRVAAWVAAKGIEKGVCSLDVTSGRWSTHDDGKAATARSPAPSGFGARLP